MSGSKAFIEKKLSKARLMGANSTAAAARNCAKMPAAELSRDAAGDIDDRGACKHGQEAYREHRVTQRVLRDPGDERDQRRLVNVAPGEMIAAGHVIKLVAEESVVIDAGELNQDFKDDE